MLKRVGNAVFFLTGAAFLGQGQCDEAGTGQAGHWRAASSLQVSALTSRGIFYRFFHYFIQHCFICRPSESTVSEDAGIKPRTVATTAVRRSNHSARSIHSPLSLQRTSNSYCPRLLLPYRTGLFTLVLIA